MAPRRTDLPTPLPHGDQSVKEWLSALRDTFGNGWLDSFDITDAMGRRRPKPKLLTPRTDRACYVARLDLDTAKPPIWRRLRLASDLKLDELHVILQIAMGWTDSHLHQFKMGPDDKNFLMEPFLTSFDLEEGSLHGTLESEVRLDEVVGEPGHRLFYEYDFGDGWHHTLKLEKAEPWREGDPPAVCIAGRRACPPENVGGLYGYSVLLAALAGDIDLDEEPWLSERLDWLPEDFDPAAFDPSEVNRLLATGELPLSDE